MYFRFYFIFEELLKQNLVRPKLMCFLHKHRAVEMYAAEEALSVIFLMSANGQLEPPASSSLREGILDARWTVGWWAIYSQSQSCGREKKNIFLKPAVEHHRAYTSRSDDNNNVRGVGVRKFCMSYLLSDTAKTSLSDTR